MTNKNSKIETNKTNIKKSINPKSNWWRKKITEKKKEVTEFEAKMDKVYLALNDGLSLWMACRFAGIWINTVKRYIEADKTGELERKIYEAKNNLLNLAFKRVKKELENWGDWRAAIEIIKRTDKRYKDKGEIDHKGIEPITKIIIEWL